MTTLERSSYTARRLEAIVERALRDAGALEVVPTPLDAVRRAAGIQALQPTSALPVEAGLRGRAVLGALWFEERIAYVEPRQSPARRRFTEAHEIVHALCPWHEAVLRLDTADELFRPVADAIEAEANAGAGLLIFQGARFAREAARATCSIDAALELARQYEASVHATLHHYVHSHAASVAMLTVGRFPRRDGGLPVWRSVESAAFRRRHGSAASHYPSGLTVGTALLELVEGARVTSGAVTTEVRLGGDRDGALCRAEAHYNRHVFFVLLVEPSATYVRGVARGLLGPGEVASPSR